MRSHPPSLVTLAKRALADECGVTKTSHVLVALSGGPDSMTLLHVLCMLRDKRLLARVSAHGVDHGLRADAAAELDVAARFCESLAVPFARTRVAVAPGGNLQARARVARWDALAEAKRELGADVIATAHHADDRAETVLIRLLRGAPAAALYVLPARDGDRIRPFIHARRAEVRAHAARHRVPSSDDPSNASPRFLRTRIRTEVLPLLESLSPRIVEHLLALSDAMADPMESPLSGRREDALLALLGAAIDPKIESGRALRALEKLARDPEKYAGAHVLLKGSARGVVLFAPGAQAFLDRSGESRDDPPNTPNSQTKKRNKNPKRPARKQA
jgi:tRNA(Ile)-lysidine synthase